jgi:hypothetical protein
MTAQIFVTVFRRFRARCGYAPPSVIAAAVIFNSALWGANTVCARPSCRAQRKIALDTAAIELVDEAAALDPTGKKLPDSPAEPKRARADLIGRFANSAGCKQRLLVSSWTRNLIARV